MGHKVQFEARKAVAKFKTRRKIISGHIKERALPKFQLIHAGALHQVELEREKYMKLIKCNFYCDTSQ